MVFEMIKKDWLLISTFYIIFTSLLRFKFSFPFNLFLFWGGGLFGIYFLEIFEKTLKITPSPFKNVLFEGVFALFSFFVISSTNSFFGAGLVLILFLNLLFEKWQSFRKKGEILSWFWPARVKPKSSGQKVYFWLMVLIFFLETLLFVK